MASGISKFSEVRLLWTFAPAGAKSDDDDADDDDKTSMTFKGHIKSNTSREEEAFIK